MIVLQKILLRSKLYSIDEFGVVNYKMRFVLFFSLVMFIALILTFGAVTYYVEYGIEGATIKNWSDALWLMVMSSTTIGFGDHYPVTFVGRIMVTLMFVFGVGIIGGIGALITSKVFGFSDTNVKNRELRKQNSEIYLKLLEIEQHLNIPEKTEHDISSK